MAAHMAKESPSQSLDRIMVRLPDGMRDRIAEIAERNGRSMNAEVVARLEASFEHDETQATLDDLQEEYEKVQAQVMNIDKQFKAYLSERLSMRDWMMMALDAAAHDKPIPPMPKFDDPA